MKSVFTLKLVFFFFFFFLFLMGGRLEAHPLLTLLNQALVETGETLKLTAHLTTVDHGLLEKLTLTPDSLPAPSDSTQNEFEKTLVEIFVRNRIREKISLDSHKVFFLENYGPEDDPTAARSAGLIASFDKGFLVIEQVIQYKTRFEEHQKSHTVKQLADWKTRGITSPDNGVFTEDKIFFRGPGRELTALSDLSVRNPQDIDFLIRRTLLLGTDPARPLFLGTYENIPVKDIDRLIERFYKRIWISKSTICSSEMLFHTLDSK